MLQSHSDIWIGLSMKPALVKYNLERHDMEKHNR